MKKSGFLVLAVAPMATAQVSIELGAGALDFLYEGQVAPSGAGVVVAQLEAFEGGDRYLPEFPGEGQGIEFFGKTFEEESGASGESGHARNVGRRFYGNVTSLAPLVDTVSCFSASGFFSDVLGQTGSTVNEVSDLPVEVASAAFIGLAGEDEDVNPILTALDQSINVSGYLCVVGMNNGSGTSVPELLAPSYNAISVGVSSGNHSRGVTPVTVAGAGRTKPEIVIPETTTSWATGFLSGVAAHLESATDEDLRPEVLKAILMAGATKDEFTTWDRTESRPLDEVFGAGEAHLVNSLRMVIAGEQPLSHPARRGWALEMIPENGVLSFDLTVPELSSEGEFSLIATWNRTLSFQVDQTGPPSSRMSAYVADDLPDVSLEIFNASNERVQRSDSPIDNVEHLYLPELAPGDYRVEVETDLVVEVALAWRLDLEHEPCVTTVNPEAAMVTLTFEDLIPEARYALSESQTLEENSWSIERYFTPMQTFGSLDEIVSEQDAFYRLEFLKP